MNEDIMGGADAPFIYFLESFIILGVHYFDKTPSLCPPPPPHPHPPTKKATTAVGRFGSRP